MFSRDGTLISASAAPHCGSLMGCDMTSQFLGYGKKTAWAAWTSIPDLTDTLAALAHDPDLFSLRSVQVHRNERFTVLMYRKGCGAFSVSQARFHLFTSRPRSGELRTQKLKSYLVRTQSLNVRPLKPGVGQYIAIHAVLASRDSSLLVSALPVHSPAFFPKPLPSFSCVGCG